MYGYAGWLISGRSLRRQLAKEGGRTAPIEIGGTMDSMRSVMVGDSQNIAPTVRGIDRQIRFAKQLLVLK